MIINKIGDAHLGKKFEVGVPLHRRGDRERTQLAQFRAALLEPANLCIQMGDIFDKFVVPYGVIMEVAAAYADAKAANPDTIYALIRGNHDAARDVERVSAFDILTAILRPMGVIVAREEPIAIQLFTPPTIITDPNHHSWHVLIPWHPVITAAEMVEHPAVRDADVVYGHWDVVMGQENQLPAEALKALGVKRAVTGHDHNKRTLEMDGLEVEVVGSMQPYSHAEDPDGQLYVTVSLAEALVGDFHDKCVRVQLVGDEVLDQPIDCLQLTVMREKQEQEAIDVDFEAFDLRRLFDQARGQVGLEPDFAAEIFTKLEEERAARG